jgi:hypothetical protein
MFQIVILAVLLAMAPLISGPPIIKTILLLLIIVVLMGGAMSEHKD